MQKNIETIPTSSLHKLARWHWPGNIRELENLVERAVVLSPTDRLAISVPELTDEGMNPPPANIAKFDDQDKILRILKETKGRVGGADGAAARLGLKRTTLISRIKRLGIDPQRSPSGYAGFPRPIGECEPRRCWGSVTAKEESREAIDFKEAKNEGACR